jgi:hypothetical protein
MTSAARRRGKPDKKHRPEAGAPQARNHTGQKVANGASKKKTTRQEAQRTSSKYRRTKFKEQKSGIEERNG